ncbi:MAG: replicative DNA helicase [Candidatus Vogelbacteria bacterium]|nr:replicative DNA helicase [Candidatus Vogelbacteria bacterium]
MSDNNDKPFASPGLKVPPHDLTAEQAFLGSVMLRPEVMHEVVDVVYPDDMYSGKHRIIFKTIRALYDDHDPIDAVSVGNKLKDNKQLDQAGGASYLAELMNSVPSASNAEYYGEIVAKKSALRRLIASADKILELGYNERDHVDSIFDKAEHLIFNLASFTKKTFAPIRETLSEVWERFDKLNGTDVGMRGVPTGYKDIDNKLSGLQKSDLVILAARPSVGKTSFALDIARNVSCHQGKTVAFFSLEMSKDQLAERMLSGESGIDLWHLRNGKVGKEDDLIRLRDALETLSKAQLIVDDSPSINITQMKASARRIKAEFGLDLIIVDYLQLMIPKRDTDSMVQQVTEISRSLKALARELEVPVVALSQLSRDVEKRGGKPRLSDLRDSGSIEQDADVVMFIHREDRLNEGSDRKNIAEIIIAKHRNGPTGEVELFFDAERTRFLSIEKGDFGGFGGPPAPAYTNNNTNGFGGF